MVYAQAEDTMPFFPRQKMRLYAKAKKIPQILFEFRLKNYGVYTGPKMTFFIFQPHVFE
jgi:hypothetical protein